MNAILEEWKTRPLGQVILSRLLAEQRELDRPPEPWDTDTDRAVHRPDALLVCHRCFAPQGGPAWFCQECGGAVGPYNNVMPFVRIFSIGEVMRSGVAGEAKFTPLTAIGYNIAAWSYLGLLAPLYVVRLAMNYARKYRQRKDDVRRGCNPEPMPHKSFAAGVALNVVWFAAVVWLLLPHAPVAGQLNRPGLTTDPIPGSGPGNRGEIPDMWDMYPVPRMKYENSKHYYTPARPLSRAAHARVVIRL